ncbi:Auxin efflux carrier component 3 [Sesamum angolense]|uniref:Auxin efflux carrier component 3 n=1 Tax=Sesamum angolense TaxID=2727404 RepID=A0AAE1WVR6_9LAMI|nr:Auxin efflux carrier component 3 [Sesamum angolense]
MHYYGEYSAGLMVILLSLQCGASFGTLFCCSCSSSTLAKMLIMEQFPETAASIVSFKVESDVVSLDGQDFLETDAELGNDGKLHVTVRKSNASRRSLGPGSFSGLICIRCSHQEGQLQGHRISKRTVRRGGLMNSPRFGYYPPQPVPTSYPAPNPEIASTLPRNAKAHQPQLSMSVGGGLHVFGGPDFGSFFASRLRSDQGAKEIRFVGLLIHPQNGENKAVREPGDFAEGRLQLWQWRGDIMQIREKTRVQLGPNFLSNSGQLQPLPLTRSNPFRHLSFFDAGLGMAMFSLGLFMALQPKIIACGNTVASFAMAVRFLTGPAVMAAASIAVGLRAALPQGIVPFVFAKEYNVHPAILSTAVIFGMLIALPITLVYYILLGL